MDASMINKIQKAGEYASQPERATFVNLTVAFQGENNAYTLRFADKRWYCDCPGFQKYAICPHIMTLENLFKAQLKIKPLPYSPGQNIVSDVKKAKRYSDQPDRIRIISFNCTFEGYNKDHHISYDEGKWTSTASFFAQRGVCSHTMALEKILKGFVEPVRAQTLV